MYHHRCAGSEDQTGLPGCAGSGGGHSQDNRDHGQGTQLEQEQKKGMTGSYCIRDGNTHCICIMLSDRTYDSDAPYQIFSCTDNIRLQ